MKTSNFLFLLVLIIFLINCKKTDNNLEQKKVTSQDSISFNPNLTYGTMTDIDGNVYKTIIIGTQTWMAENLKVTHYRNGDSIPNVKDTTKWGYFEIRTGAYCWYNNNILNKRIYGAIYNWYAASDSQNIAPLGWHVASLDDWQTLMNYVNPTNNIQNLYGYKLRETGTKHWTINNLSNYPTVTNETGFTAIAGCKNAGQFMGINEDWAYFWTSTGTSDGSRCIYLGLNIIIDIQGNARGFNIRCVKD
jgi:uncharacterized protein (TIGR02145 family)